MKLRRLVSAVLIIGLCIILFLPADAFAKFSSIDDGAALTLEFPGRGTLNNHGRNLNPCPHRMAVSQLCAGTSRGEDYGGRQS